MKIRNKGILPKEDMNGMTPDEYMEWLNNYLLYEDDALIPMPSPKDQAFLDALGSQRYRVPEQHYTAQQGDGSGWVLFAVMFVIGMALLIAKGLGVL